MPTVNEIVAEPAFEHRFRQGKAQELISEVLKAKLHNVTYHADNTSTWTREIADDIKIKLKELNLDRYKFVVQVVIGEQRGEGVKMGCRCFWDANTDNFATAEYSNSSIFCVACAFGVYLY